MSGFNVGIGAVFFWLLTKLSAFVRMLKRSWKSWTINWHLLALMVGHFNDNVAQVVPFLKGFIDDPNVGVVLMVMGLAGVILRFKTTKPLTER